MDKKNKSIDNSKKIIHLQKSNGASVVYDWLHSIIFSFAVVLIILTFFVRLVDVNGASMMNTLMDGDKVLVTNFLYEPKTNDIVIISHGAHYDKPLVKRVIATEGQKLSIDFENQIVRVDGRILPQPYAVGETDQRNAEIPEVIPEGKVFVMGDNRYVSSDSRNTEVGLINESDIIGKAQFVVFPFESFKYLG